MHGSKLIGTVIIVLLLISVGVGVSMLAALRSLDQSVTVKLNTQDAILKEIRDMATADSVDFRQTEVVDVHGGKHQVRTYRKLKANGEPQTDDELDAAHLEAVRKFRDRVNQ